MFITSTSLSRVFRRLVGSSGTFPQRVDPLSRYCTTDASPSRMPFRSAADLSKVMPARLRTQDKMLVVDSHVCGEPARVILGGDLIPDIAGTTAFEKMQSCARDHDWIRLAVLNEPRGYPPLCANLVLPSAREDCAFSFVIMEPAKVYPPMSGHNTIAVATVLLEAGLVPMREPTTVFNLEAPAGLIEITADVAQGKVPTLGEVPVDVAYGGMIYALVDAADLGVEIRPENGKEIVRLGEMVKVAAREALPVRHPENPQIEGVQIMVMRGPPQGPGASARNTVVLSTGHLDWSKPATWTGVLDRSPCGTGTCAVMAVKHARGELAVGDPFVHESILGTTFEGMLHATTTVGDYPAVIPSIKAEGHITGIAELTIDPRDPFPEGFQVGDIW